MKFAFSPSAALPSLLKPLSLVEPISDWFTNLGQTGYRIHLFFLMVSSIEVALSRIKERVVKVAMMYPKRSCVGGSIVRFGTRAAVDQVL